MGCSGNELHYGFVNYKKTADRFFKYSSLLSLKNGVPLGNHSVNKKSSITFKAFYSFMNDFTPKGTFSVFITVLFLSEDNMLLLS